jgi:exonuclease VII large subunit
MEKEHFEVLLEDILGKFELVLEGQQSLRTELKQEIQDVREEMIEKFKMTTFMIERLSQKLDERTTALDQKIDERTTALDQKIDERTTVIEQKLDKLAADFAEHRADTEAHKGYVVYEK